MVYKYDYYQCRVSSCKVSTFCTNDCEIHNSPT